jgi:protein TonB
MTDETRAIFDNVATTRMGSRQWYTVPLSMLAHSIGLTALVMVPLLAAGMLPSPQSVIVFAMAPPPILPVPPPVPVAASVTPVAAANPDAAPLSAPAQITPEPPAPALTAWHVASAGVPESLAAAGPALLAAPPEPIAPPAFVRPGGAIKEPRKLHDVRPIYPGVALSARIEGMVIIEATISKDGKVVDARVLRSQPLLDQAAVDAVRQWTFTPTTLNGIPIDVKMTVSVNFTLH